jgi:hypothetical protein
MNLAGHVNPNFTIERELIRCRIDVVHGETSKGEVATSLTGRLGPFTFRRAWYYWVASGPVPLDVADELYADPVGREDVRVAGHCGCPAPRDHGVTWYGGDGARLNETGKRDEFLRYLASSGQGMKESAARMLDDYRFVDNPAAVGRGFVELYHIDSEVGLRLFADTIRRHGLDRSEDRP